VAKVRYATLTHPTGVAHLNWLIRIVGAQGLRPV